MSITSVGLQQLGFKSLNIDPAGDFRLEDDSNGAGPYIKEWKSASPQPTQAEIEAAEAAWNTANGYKSARQDAYPSIGDQLDMLWHAVDTGDWTAAKVKTTEFYTALKAVKDANPKP